MNNKTFVDPQVAEFINAHYISIKINAEKDKGSELRKKYSVSGFPSVVFTTSDGSEVDRIVGFLPPLEYLKTARDYQANKNTLGDYQARLKTNPADIELNYEVGNKYAERGKFEQSRSYFKKVTDLDADNSSGKVDNAVFMSAILKFYQNDKKGAATDLNAFIIKYPDSDVLNRAYKMLANYYSSLNEPDNVVKTYRAAIKKFPEDKELHNAFAWFLAENNLHLDEALLVAKKAVALGPQDIAILDTLAEVYYKRKEYDSAIETITTAIRIEPDDDYLKKQLGKFKQAQAK
ncbi:tetratricopeptide repeat protein [candidate division CSSED10-310 bacterium]|uniref:Tetratricopeptide repeat protein n=1 Tax=candidate division CSSED10-310 bacterium TaxID=2855610 RepID=A0ABV6Z4F8_UNCC1